MVTGGPKSRERNLWIFGPILSLQILDFFQSKISSYLKKIFEFSIKSSDFQREKIQNCPKGLLRSNEIFHKAFYVQLNFFPIIYNHRLIINAMRTSNITQIFLSMNESCVRVSLYYKNTFSNMNFCFKFFSFIGKKIIK